MSLPGLYIPKLEHCAMLLGIGIEWKFFLSSLLFYHLTQSYTTGCIGFKLSLELRLLKNVFEKFEVKNCHPCKS